MQEEIEETLATRNDLTYGSHCTNWQRRTVSPCFWTDMLVNSSHGFQSNESKAHIPTLHTIDTFSLLLMNYKSKGILTFAIPHACIRPLSLNNILGDALAGSWTAIHAAAQSVQLDALVLPYRSPIGGVVILDRRFRNQHADLERSRSLPLMSNTSFEVNIIDLESPQRSDTAFNPARSFSQRSHLRDCAWRSTMGRIIVHYSTLLKKKSRRGLMWIFKHPGPAQNHR